MGTSKTKTPNFDKNLDSSRMVKQIKSNMRLLGNEFKSDANAIAPLDTGKLRNSAVVKIRGFNVTVSWTADYAIYPHEKNKKNPQTTKWGEKANKRYKSKYQKMIRNDVVL